MVYSVPDRSRVFPTWVEWIKWAILFAVFLSVWMLLRRAFIPSEIELANNSSVTLSDIEVRCGLVLDTIPELLNGGRRNVAMVERLQESSPIVIRYRCSGELRQIGGGYMTVHGQYRLIDFGGDGANVKIQFGRRPGVFDVYPSWEVRPESPWSEFPPWDSNSAYGPKTPTEPKQVDDHRLER